MENNTNGKGAQNTDGPAPPQQAQVPYGYYPYYQPPPPTKRSDKPRIAGGMLIVTGILGLILGIMMIAGGTYMMNIENFNIDGGQVDISGVVLASDSTPIGNATVSIEGTHITVMTDALGHYQMLGVPGGFQKITLEKSGYNTIVRNVYIVPEDGDQSMAWGNQMIITEDTELNYTMTAGSETFIYGEEGNMMSMDGMESLVMLFGVVFVICAIGSIIGGAYALKSEKYPVTIIGAVMGIFSVGFGIGSILAIIALIILILSSNEFNGKR